MEKVQFHVPNSVHSIEVRFRVWIRVRSGVRVRVSDRDR